MIDFEKFAERWCFTEEDDSVDDQQVRREEMVAELKGLWNARGEADIEAVEAEAWRVHNEAQRTGRSDIEMNMRKAIKELDR